MNRMMIEYVDGWYHCTIWLKDTELGLRNIETKYRQTIKDAMAEYGKFVTIPWAEIEGGMDITMAWKK